ncbi:hypothetical protein Btru_061609 [Bulinus truncatus]|nr:hypothetical protein Btru_061609 [Bulinus truncatus]
MNQPCVKSVPVSQNVATDLDGHYQKTANNGVKINFSISSILGLHQSTDHNEEDFPSRDQHSQVHYPQLETREYVPVTGESHLDYSHPLDNTDSCELNVKIKRNRTTFSTRQLQVSRLEV